MARWRQGFAISLALVVFALCGCAAKQSVRCVKVCEVENDCHEALKTNVFFEERDCVAACTALERDTASRSLVEAHATCLDKAGSDCQAALACK